MPVIVYLVFLAFLIGMGITYRWLGCVLLVASMVTMILVIVAIKYFCNAVHVNKSIRQEMIKERAKIAKADGVVSTSEIRVAEACFKRFGVIGSPEKDFCVNAFHLAKK